MTTLGREIKKARASLGLQQKDLQKLTGISQAYLSLIETDKAEPGFAVVLKIAKALHMSLDPLVQE